MEKFKNLIEKNNLLLPSVILSLCFILTGYFISNSVNSFADKGQNITVTGSAEKLVEADIANWIININAKGYGPNSISDADQSMESKRSALVNFLKANGIEENKIIVSATVQQPMCNLNKDGYENCSLGQVGINMSQNISLESNDVYKIDKLSKDINQVPALEIQNNNVQYLYNELKNIRKSMLADATRNAKERADAVANAGGAKVSRIVSLSSGVFQVTAKNDISAEDYGSYDTTTIDKKITATVRADFSLR